MISKIKIAYLRSLHDKKIRHQEGVFIVEGEKSIRECMESDLEIVEGFFIDPGTSEECSKYFLSTLITQTELDKITQLKSNDYGMIIVRIPRTGIDLIQSGTLDQNRYSDEIGSTLILDGINDPGNLGAIIRIADWYGISRIVCSLDTVDCYNSKVIMATMGSFTRVMVEYRELGEYLERLHTAQNTAHRVVYGAYLDGESIRTKEFSLRGTYLVIGSESHGIRPYIAKYITEKITIPRIGKAESLNAAIATGIILERMQK